MSTTTNHIERLLQGTDVWNKWRKENPNFQDVPPKSGDAFKWMKFDQNKYKMRSEERRVGKECRL